MPSKTPYEFMDDGQGDPKPDPTQPRKVAYEFKDEDKPKEPAAEKPRTAYEFKDEGPNASRSAAPASENPTAGDPPAPPAEDPPDLPPEFPEEAGGGMPTAEQVDALGVLMTRLLEEVTEVRAILQDTMGAE